jgi:prepilin-type N-terminal cleavage/methylation domain-containing protein
VKNLKAFTLIELLIVVAIIAILAAIAVPNFLEAQVRSKVSRALADMRSIATALESYRIDNTGYPLAIVDAPIAPSYNPSLFRLSVYARITTPVAYMTSFPTDAFEGQWNSTPVSDPLKVQKFYDYRRIRFGLTGGGASTIFESATGLGIGLGSRFDSWLLYSPGPDKEQNINTRRAGRNTVNVAGFGDPLAQWPIYDPTNGTVSWGDVVRAREAAGAELVRP